MQEEDRQDTVPDDEAPGLDPAGQALEEALAQVEAYKDQYLRTAAELENTRKRAQRDIEHAHRYALERFAGELMTVRDSLEMGLSAGTGHAQEPGVSEGLAITLRQLDQVLERFGVTLIDPVGGVFDPEQHEAMAARPDGTVAPGSVLEVVQKGAALNGRLLRPARVLVATGLESVDSDPIEDG